MTQYFQKRILAVQTEVLIGGYKNEKTQSVEICGEVVMRIE
jgi:hypothetical protein